MWEEVKTQIVADANSFKMGSPEDPSNFINAVIDEKAFDRIAHTLTTLKNNPMLKLLLEVDTINLKDIS